MPRLRRNNTAGADDGYFAPPTPRVLAHRGLAIDAPENTLLAFARALSVGASHIETDVHVSADGVAMVSHDADLRRVAGRALSVLDLTANELRRIDLGFGQGFCSLSEALDGFPDARFNIDIKAAGAVGPTIEAIRETGAIKRVLVGSFSSKRRLAAVRELPGIATSVSARGAVAAIAAARSRAARPLSRILRDVDAVQLPVSVLGMPSFTARTIGALHRAGVEVHAWTINTLAEMDRLLALGVDGLVTDRADLAMEAIQRRAA